MFLQLPVAALVVPVLNHRRCVGWPVDRAGFRPGHHWIWTLGPAVIGILTLVVSLGVTSVSVVIGRSFPAGHACCRCRRHTPAPEAWTPRCRSWSIGPIGCPVGVRGPVPSKASVAPSTRRTGDSLQAPNLNINSSQTTLRKACGSAYPRRLRLVPAPRLVSCGFVAHLITHGRTSHVQAGTSGTARAFIMPHSAFYISPRSLLSTIQTVRGKNTGLPWPGVGWAGLDRLLRAFLLAAAGGGFDFDLSWTTTAVVFQRVMTGAVRLPSASYGRR